MAIDKCVFEATSVDFLGYKINEQGITPLERKISAIIDIPEPSKQKQLLSYLGMLNFYRHCFKKLPPTKTCVYPRHASEVLKPLYYIATTPLKSQKEFQKLWSENPQYKQAFEDSKLLVKNAVTLNHTQKKNHQITKSKLNHH